MKYFMILIFLLPQSAFADCNPWNIEQALSSRLDNIQPKEIPATKVDSTDGGVWQIFREEDGRLNTLIRHDFGESGKTETRLSVINRSTYGISISEIRYLFAIYKGKPNGIATRTIKYFYYCDGKPFVKEAEIYPQYRFGDLNSKYDNINDYLTDAINFRNDLINDPDIREVTKGLKQLK